MIVVVVAVVVVAEVELAVLAVAHAMGHVVSSPFRSHEIEQKSVLLQVVLPSQQQKQREGVGEDAADFARAVVVGVGVVVVAAVIAIAIAVEIEVVATRVVAIEVAVVVASDVGAIAKVAVGDSDGTVGVELDVLVWHALCCPFVAAFVATVDKFSAPSRHEGCHYCGWVCCYWCCVRHCYC